MSKKINTSGPSSGFIADPTITPFPINWNRLNKIRFEDAPTDYILLCKLAEKYNEIVEATNSLEEAMEQFFGWVEENLGTYAREYLQQLLEEGELLIDDVVYTFDTTNIMLSKALKDGDIVKTLGYYNVNDKGGALYQILDTQPTTYYETLDNGKFARLIFEPVMTFVQFGLKPNVQENQNDLLNNIFQILNGTNVTIDDSNTYYVRPVQSSTESSSIKVSSNITIKNTTFKLFDNNPQFTEMFHMYSVHDIRFENVTFDQNIENNTQMLVDIDKSVRHWWATFYNENIQDVTFYRCISKHQGIWFLNCSNRPNDTTERVRLEECKFYRHYKHQSTWYDNTDVFLNALDSHVINCEFQSDSIESQTAIELHSAYSSAVGNKIDGYRCGIIITNLDTGLIAMRRDETSISVRNNTITTVACGISIYPTTPNNDYNGLFIEDNFIYVDTLHFGNANGYGIMTQYSTTMVGTAWLRNIHINNNVIDWKQDTYASSDKFATTVFCGIGLSCNFNIDNMIITNNIIKNAMGTGILVSVDLLPDSSERKIVNGLVITNNVINNPQANPNLNHDASETSSYIYIVGKFQECFVGGNVLRYVTHKPLAQVLVYGSLAGNDTLSLTPNYTDNPINTGWINGSVNTANATQIKQPALFVDASGLVHLRGSYTIGASGNGKTQANIPEQYAPASQTTFGAVTINQDGSITSYAGNNQTVYLDDIIYRPYTYNLINNSRR